jgi:class 3 adenylate cyclase
MALPPDPNPQTDAELGALGQQPSAGMVVLFADVAGSTKLYDSLGDVLAKKMVDECLALMSATVARYGGRVIKTIGDEVMCVLPDADNACLAATDIQLGITALPAVQDRKRAVRVGLHFGPVIEDNADVFGDTVNLASRMAGLAKAMQIITTHDTVQRLSPVLRKASRAIAALSVKGKDDDIEVAEIIWQTDVELTMVTPSIAAKPKTAKLHLQCGAMEMLVEQPNASIVLGRDLGCQVVVADRMASRQHARIERRQDKFFLIDQSSNGTYVSFEGKPEISLRREEVVLRGQGRIAFGRSVGESSEATVVFTVHG